MANATDYLHGGAHMVLSWRLPGTENGAVQPARPTEHPIGNEKNTPKGGRKGSNTQGVTGVQVGTSLGG